ncbi:carbohydrate ABC transporter permease [Egicoccus sp. AB-alg2]|uniref:carbohydrate ABC transporter permease n=1 Tax=Egicoccus sp. AB-alg2 TaxID=3242693 RepID=UPI00359CDBD5
MTQLLTAFTAIALGVGGVLVLFWGLNVAVDRTNEKTQDKLRPWVFIGPAMLVVTLFLLVPAVDTFRRSFLGPASQEFVGLANYEYLVTDPQVRTAIWNNLLWILIVPAVSVAIGLVVAVLADRMSETWEKISKSLIFLPMAISFVGASTIWGFIYAWRTPGTPQIGLLNAIWTAFGNEPVGWLQNFAINDFALMAIMIWLQTGFAMVLLSAAIKNVPVDTIEAARVDGASEIAIFWRVIVPQIRSTIVVVATTILILVLKIFDIVYVMTDGNYGTDVIANLFIRTMFNFGQFGQAAVLVVFLIVVTVPFMIINIRRFREQEAMR